MIFTLADALLSLRLERILFSTLVNTRAYRKSDNAQPYILPNSSAINNT